MLYSRFVCIFVRVELRLVKKRCPSLRWRWWYVMLLELRWVHHGGLNADACPVVQCATTRENEPWNVQLLGDALCKDELSVACFQYMRAVGMQKPLNAFAIV